MVLRNGGVAGTHRRRLPPRRRADQSRPGARTRRQLGRNTGHRPGGRAWARLHQPRETYDAIDRVDRLASSLARPDRPEHHYRYDPNKSVAYMATTLAWVGDPAAESHARDVITRFTPIAGAGRWPRRLAVANLDLALSLLVTDRLDEACDAARRAITSGQVVPSNHWRAAEVVAAVEARQLPEAPDLRDAYEQLRSGGIES